MIRGLISQGTPLIPVGTDGEIWYTLVNNGKISAFGSVARTLPTGFSRCVVVHKFNNGKSFNFITKRVVFPEEPTFDDHIKDPFSENVILEPQNVNLAIDEGLFAGVRYLPNQSVSCFGTVRDQQDTETTQESSFRGVDSSVIVSKTLQIVFIPYTIALSKFNEGVCSPVSAKHQLFFDFLNGIDSLGDFNGKSTQPANCNKLTASSQGCYTIGVSCYSMNYCSEGVFCDTGNCYGKVKDQSKGRCSIHESAYLPVKITQELDAVSSKAVEKTTESINDHHSKLKKIIVIALILGVIALLIGVAFHRSFK